MQKMIIKKNHFPENQWKSPEWVNVNIVQYPFTREGIFSERWMDGWTDWWMDGWMKINLEKKVTLLLFTESYYFIPRWDYVLLWNPWISFLLTNFPYCCIFYELAFWCHRFVMNSCLLWGAFFLPYMESRKLSRSDLIMLNVNMMTVVKL